METPLLDWKGTLPFGRLTPPLTLAQLVYPTITQKLVDLSNQLFNAHALQAQEPHENLPDTLLAVGTFGMPLQSAEISPNDVVL